MMGFRDLLSQVTTRLEGRPLNADLEALLNREFSAEGPVTRAIFDACRDAIAAGWMCNREAGGNRYGRVIKPDSAPTVSGGTARVLYLLPQGAIEFTKE